MQPFVLTLDRAAVGCAPTRPVEILLTGVALLVDGGWCAL